ncbi:Uncharacterised protein [[Clostridium] sordellii]|uniref:hypothetical protein n=1 Tax=Paraclostridium sordellii TaxID=1505 RepID=UPI0005E4218B|nr:hypothetical protein [Paeniclostridium sordellii]CEP97583.1 Uncharacterised protein [[Clostridium] sordellii] [Paeniclostridium sordellii]
MVIGKILESRMNALGMNIDQLSDRSFVEKETIEEILNNRLGLDDIDMFDLEIISKCLYCNVNYFTDEKYRKKDIIHSSMNRGNNDTKSNNVKGQLQVIASDFIFLKQIMTEIQ